MRNRAAQFTNSAVGIFIFMALILFSTCSNPSSGPTPNPPSTAKALQSFDFAALAVTGAVDELNHSVTILVSNGTDTSNLTPTIRHSGISVSPASGVAQNFDSPINYVVSAADGSTQTYVVTVNKALSQSKSLIGFGFSSPSAVGVITESNHTVAVTVPFGTNVGALSPTISHTGSSVSPASGAVQDFSSPVSYSVTAADGSVQSYAVTVIVAPNTVKAINSFAFSNPPASGVIDESNHLVSVTVPYGTNVSSLIPTISHTGATISPASGLARNFSNPVLYTVTAADGSTQIYSVSVAVAPNAAKAITSFVFGSLSASGTITESNHSIAVTVPYGTNLNSLVPTIAHTGSMISPASETSRNFTTPVDYTVTAADGTTQVYTVTVTVALNAAKSITGFGFASPSASGTVNESNHSVSITVPFGTNVSNLTPSISHSGASVTPASGVACNFTNPVSYTVTAQDGSTQAYTVAVSVMLNPAKAITSFGFPGPGVTGTVNESNHTVAITVPYGTGLTALAPAISHTGASISPSSGVARNFTSPVNYQVTAADGSTQSYLVTVSVALNTAKAITSFKFASPSVTGAINESNHTIAVGVPFGTSLQGLYGDVTHTGASIVPGFTGLDYTNPVKFTVTAADGSTQDYMVTVTVVGSALVSFDSQSATVPANPASIEVFAPAKTVGSLPAPPTRVGYDFAGWYTGVDGTGTQFLANTVIASAKTVYAKWNISSSGSNWTTGALPETITWNGVAYGNGVFVAVGNTGTAAVSANGVDWTTGTLPAALNWSAIAYGNGIFVAVANGSSIAATSTDGITWFSRTMPAAHGWSSVAYGNGVFVAVAYLSSSNIGFKASSSDGINWDPRGIDTGNDYSNIAYGNSTFVAICYSASKTLTSSNGISWTTHTSAPNGAAITFGGGKFLCVTNAATVYSSSDGINWTSKVVGTLGTNAWDVVAYGNGVFVALSGAAKLVAVSPDGLNWVIRSTPVSPTWSAMTFGGGRFMAVSEWPYSVFASAP